jgi:hypothetical protein
MSNPLYTRPFVNASGETMPAFAVWEMGGWVDDSKGVSVFRAIKPTAGGKVFYVNGPLPVPAGSNGWGATADGHWALFSGASTPALNQEYGPKAGTWTLSADKPGGFIVAEDVRGSAAPPPGSPPAAATKRVRVVERAKAKVQNRIQGTVAMTVTETTPTFLINKIIVLSGVDPRQNPGSQVESIPVVNSLRKAYVNGVDVVTATQSEVDLLWYVETAPAAGSEVIPFELEDKTYGANHALARQVTPAGGVDTASPPFYVVDGQNRHYGRKAEDNLGYRGHAVRFIENYQEGLPGYRILEMEAPASLMAVTLNEDLTGASVRCVVDTNNQIWGRAGNNRRFPPTGFAEIRDDFNVATGARKDARWVVGWSESKEYYIFLFPITPPDSGLLFGWCEATIPAATFSAGSKTVSPGTTAAAVYKAEWDGLGLKATGDAIHGVNWSQTPINASAGQPLIVSGIIKNGLPTIARGFVIHAVYDLRMLPLYNPSANQIAVHPVGAPCQWEEIETILTWLAGYVAEQNMSIGKNSGGGPAWQEDTLECEEETP